MFREIPQETCWAEGHRRRVEEVRQVDAGGGSDGGGTDPEPHTYH
jgi:hypothetical protein